jgi:drug/metabolite transporter (DMT)-like permease
MKEKLYWKMLAGGGLAAAGITLIGCEPALAKTAGELGAHIASQGDNLGKAVSAMSYVIGMGAGAATAFKFKANRENPQHHPISHALGWAIVCVGLLFLPQTFKNTGDTFYGTDATQNVSTGITTIGN